MPAVYDWREQQDLFSVMNPSRVEGVIRVPVAVDAVPALVVSASAEGAADRSTESHGPTGR